jgi:hypothetical protein
VTYPPQQPGPYGEQPQTPPPGSYPPPVGYPQQPGAYPPPAGYQQPGYQQPGYQQPGYPEQPGQQPGYPPQGFPPPGGPQPGGPQFQQFQQGGPGGVPPRRNKALPWLLGVGVLVVVVVLVGGFAWPGFFHGSDKSGGSTVAGGSGPAAGSGGSAGSGSAGSGSGGSGSGGAGSSEGNPAGGSGAGSADALFSTVSKDATDHNADAIKALACPGSELEGLDQFAQATKVTAMAPPKANGSSGSVGEFTVDTPSGALLYAIGTTNQLTGSWCVAALIPGGPAN